MRICPLKLFELRGKVKFWSAVRYYLVLYFLMGSFCFIAYSSVIPSAVLVSVKTEGGLLQQTEERTVWSSFGTHLQCKAITISIAVH